MPRRRQPRRTAAIGVAVLAVIAIVAAALTVLALQSVEPTPIDRTPEPDPTFSFGTPEATPSPSVVAEPASVPVLPRAAQRMLVFGSDPNVVWRAIEGSCAEGIAPLIERSADGGESWTDVTPLYRDVRQVLTLEPFAGNQAQAVMLLGDECEVDGLRTFTQGRFWEPYEEVLATSAFIAGDDAAQVVTPDGSIAAPCAEARGLRSDGGTVALVCDAQPFVLAGEQWQGLGIENAIALAINGETIVVAHASSECDGLVLSTVTDGATSLASCAVGVDPLAPTAVTLVGGESTVWNGDALSASEVTR